MDRPPLLIRRDAERALSLAVAWFVAMPLVVIAIATALWPFAGTAVGDCSAPPCDPTPHATMPPFIVPGLLGTVFVGFAAVGLYRLTYRQPRFGWSLVGGIGAALIVSALVADLAAGLRPEALLLTFIWPLAPGLMALDAAWRGLHAATVARG